MAKLPDRVAMDAKARSSIAGLHQKIADGDFAEEDVLAFLAAIRNVVDDDSPIRELAHLIVAHRVRDRGTFREKVREVREFVVDPELLKTRPLTIGAIFSYRQIADPLNEFFETIGLRRWSATRIDAVTLCMVSLAQQVSFEIDGEVTGILRMGQEGDQFMVAASIELVSVPGAFCLFAVLYTPDKGYLDPSVRRREVDFYAGHPGPHMYTFPDIVRVDVTSGRPKVALAERAAVSATP